MSLGNSPYQEELNHIDYERHLPQEQPIQNLFDPQVITAGDICSRYRTWVAGWVVIARTAGRLPSGKFSDT